MSVTPPSATARSLRYEPCIDGWRAVAALMVLVAHFFPHRTPPNSWLQLGESGVVIFFIISGYLISSILFAAKEEVAAGRVGTGGALRRFYIRRVLRIAPIYYGSILAFWLIRSPGVREGVWWHATYTTNFAQVFCGLDFRNAAHFWTLAVEEQFYFVWPLLVLTVSRARLGVMLWTVFFGSMAFVLVGAMTGAPWGVLTMLPVGGASVALSFGALLAYGRFYQSGIVPPLVRGSLWLGLPVFVLSQAIWTQHGGGPATYERWEYQVTYVCAVTLFFGWLFVCSLGAESLLGRVLSFAPLRYVGRISYGLYVYHWLLDPYYISIWNRLGIPEPTGAVANGCLKSLTAMVVAALSWHCFEKPILGLKDRLAPSP
jgi:peptidoglycan/LPS O-acetylase OafA/YrhL